MQGEVSQDLDRPGFRFLPHFRGNLNLGQIIRETQMPGEGTIKIKIHPPHVPVRRPATLGCMHGTSQGLTEIRAVPM